MKAKKENGFTTMDAVIAIIAITIFSTLIITLIYNNAIENIKLKKENLAMIYITEIFENVGFESYDSLKIGEYLDAVEKYDSYPDIEKIVGQEIKNDLKDGKYECDITITQEPEDVTEKENILKKIVVTLKYKITDKEYACSMERMKIKE